MKILLALVSVLVLISIASEEMSNNTSHIDNSSDNNNSSNNNNSINSNSSSYSSKNNSYNGTVYRVLVDGYHGFYRIYDITTEKEITPEDKEFNINVGDTVIWSNEDPIETFTVVSDPKLWYDRVGYLNPGKIFNYTFNRPGMFSIFVRQRSTLPYQIIIVNVPTVNVPVSNEKSSRINETVIYKTNQSINKEDINNTEDNKSKITIKIYRKNKEVSGFETIIIMPIIIILYTLKKKGLI